GTPETPAASFHSTFEKSGDNASQIGERGTSARKAYNEFTGGADDKKGGASAPPTGGCPGGGQGVVLNGYAFPLKTTKSKIHNASIFRNGTTDTAAHPYTAYDIYVDTGTPVVAFLGGKVTHLGEDRCPGRLISVYNQEHNLTVSYLHLSFNNHVALGTVVQPGDQIGVVGTLQNACNTVTHLHIDAVRDR